MLQTDATAAPDPLPRSSEPHALAVADVAEMLGSDPKRGLSDAEAAARLASFGRNELRRRGRPPYLQLAVGQLRDPLVRLLVVASAVSFAIGENIEAAAIGAIIVLNAVFGFVQEAGAARAVLALSSAVVSEVDATRAGRLRRIPAAELVPGDLVRLREGERVPADLRLVRTAGFECDESALTGESTPVAKGVEPVPPSTPLAERRSLAFAGAAVTRGSAAGLVVATGPRTEQGLVARLAEQATPAPTPLQQRLASLAGRLALLGVALTVVLAAAMAARGASWHESFLVGVSVAVAAVPEGLAATVTIALALGAREMAHRGAVVRQLSAIETIGEATMVCADKTGTLTENRLRVERLEPAPGVSSAELRQALLDLAIEELDPVDLALVAAAREDATLAPREVRWSVPFDADRRRGAVVVGTPAGALGLVKGAPETVLGLCSDPQPVFTALAESWAEEGLRVLAIAGRELSRSATDRAALDSELGPLGLVALIDPLRADAAASIEAARDLGLGVRMLTGDHPSTAAAIGRRLGLSVDEVRARCTPADKLELVDALIECGEVVAVTGDGINDAPALRRAHVGVAMGRGGTEAAREASSIVLTDDDFSTIVAAVREGRRIAANIRSFLAFLLSANLGEVALFGLAVAGGLGAPMTVVQVLVINLLTDGPPAVALAREAGAPGSARVWKTGELLGRRLVGALASIGIVVGVAALAAFLAVRELRPDAAQTAAFATVALAELLVVYSCRSLELPPWRLRPNRHLDLAVVGSLAIVAAAVFVGPLHGPLGTVSLTLSEASIVVGCAVVPFVTAELLRRLTRAGRAVQAPG